MNLSKAHSQLLPIPINEFIVIAYFQTLIRELVDRHRRLHLHVHANIELVNQMKDQHGEIKREPTPYSKSKAPLLYMATVDVNAIRLLRKG